MRNPARHADTPSSYSWRLRSQVAQRAHGTTEALELVGLVKAGLIRFELDSALGEFIEDFLLPVAIGVGAVAVVFAILNSLNWCTHTQSLHTLGHGASEREFREA